MKKYNVNNYIRYKEDVKQAIANVQLKDFVNYTNEELKVIFLPLVENISRKFATSQEASGVMSILDIIQEGSLQLCKAVDKIDRDKLIESEDVEKYLDDDKFCFDHSQKTKSEILAERREIAKTKKARLVSAINAEFEKLQLDKKGNIIFDQTINQAKILELISKKRQLKKYSFGTKKSFINI